jgi:hypothetical protein
MLKAFAGIFYHGGAGGSHGDCLNQGLLDKK